MPPRFCCLLMCFLSCFLSCFAAVAASWAQEAPGARRPFGLGLYASHASLDYDHGDRPVERGSGLGLELTYAASASFELFAAADAAFASPAFVPDFTLVNTDLGVRLRFAPTWPVRPSVGLAFNYRSKRFEGPERRSGAGLTFQAALHVALASRLSAVGSAGVTTGKLDPCDPPRSGAVVACDDVGRSPVSMRYRAGVVWRVGR